MSPVFGEAVTVTAEAPTIDLKTTTGGAKFSEQMISDLPTTRTFNGLAFQAPGVVAGGNPDGGAQEPSIGGASAAENRYVVDGLDTTDPAYGTIGSTLAFEFIEEVQVKTGGYEAEYGGALGGTLNVITKSGSNELRGDVFGYFSDDSLQSEPPPLPQSGRDLGYTEYDFGADIGGKFIEDKLWYFVAVNPSYNDIDRTTVLDNTTVTTEIERLYYAGKLTWQLAPSHQLVVLDVRRPDGARERRALARNALGTRRAQHRLRRRQLRRDVQRHDRLEHAVRGGRRLLRSDRAADAAHAEPAITSPSRRGMPIALARATCPSALPPPAPRINAGLVWQRGLRRRFVRPDQRRPQP